MINWGKPMINMELSERMKEEHFKEIEYWRKKTKDRLREIDLVQQQGQDNSAAFCLYRQIPPSQWSEVTFKEWKRDIRAAWKAYRKLTNMPTQVVATKKYIGTVGFEWIEYIAWPTSTDHPCRKELTKAEERLERTLMHAHRRLGSTLDD